MFPTWFSLAAILVLTGGAIQLSRDLSTRWRWGAVPPAAVLVPATTGTLWALLGVAVLGAHSPRVWARTHAPTHTHTRTHAGGRGPSAAARGGAHGAACLGGHVYVIRQANPALLI